MFLSFRALFEHQCSMPIRDLRNLCWEERVRDGDKFLDYTTRSLHKCSALLWSSLGCQKDRKMHISHTLGPRHVDPQQAMTNEWECSPTWTRTGLFRKCAAILFVCVRECVPFLIWYTRTKHKYSIELGKGKYKGGNSKKKDFSGRDSNLGCVA